MVASNILVFGGSSYVLHSVLSILLYHTLYADSCRRLPAAHLKWTVLDEAAAVKL